ncbi:hypothetical protein GCM10007216_12370 [Thalassobacillus devorans]|uniref:AraC family two component transcriptional regulator n=1 Tax=Thalassobacillus devorans TaxID=279813 RepID=A0ABQ1NUU2_9BACI|nr:helix-turn-helix domain-containing protein [Thalassobacillus devorans]NIK28821.1 AraC-like DNA-binding protein [Thalassobacillus devorans]GGC83290.1 hypothetical protein GCM10007216_12370 [Thalassobacillus devorans]
MYQLLIADRDRQELSGIEWLLSKYSFPISDIKQSNDLAETLNILENEQPDLLCMELDMIPEGKWEMVKAFINRHSGLTIAITIEPTFERAMQAIEISAVDLLVKPLSPSRLKSTIQQGCRQLAAKGYDNHPKIHQHSINYEDIFIESDLFYPHPVYLVRPEYGNQLNDLRTFITQFDFYNTPSLFSTTDQIILVFHEQIPEPFQQARRFLSEWERNNGGPVAIAVHDKNNGQSIHSIYQQLRKVMEATFFTGYKQVLRYEEKYLWRDMDPFLTMDEQRFWVHHLDEGQAEEIKSWLYQEFLDLRPPYPNPGLLRTRLTSILAQVRRFMIRKGLDSPDRDIRYKQVFDKILYGPVLYRIVQEIVLFINELIHTLEDQSERAIVNAGEAALSYIEENYMDPALSLGDVAGYINRSPAYFSHLLSKKYRQTFREILLQVRIQKAKELLESTDENIQQIAGAVGFNQPNYFSRVFKKVTGKTPREYRNIKV